MVVRQLLKAVLSLLLVQRSCGWLSVPTHRRHYTSQKSKVVIPTLGAEQRSSCWRLRSLLEDLERVGGGELKGDPLREEVASIMRSASPDDNSLTPSMLEQLKTNSPSVYQALDDLQNASLERGMSTLKTLLDSGEVRALDKNIANSAKNGLLDEGFFRVININIEQARKEEEEEKAAGLVASEETATVTTRFQILSHILTRCQEEMEKLISNETPATALVVKLLRTEDKNIRGNLLKNSLAPPASKGIVVDGVEISPPSGTKGGSGGGGKALVSIEDFVASVTDIVQKVRGMKDEEAVDLTASVNIIESLRQISIEGRAVVMEAFEEGSEELKTVEGALQEVFRPGS
ncbi:hypothetical protein TrVE_jg14217 [Triparma verrucosa]|uniref:Uncharacterized protein n=1 Tax=Triparma verrucosa TaxID=1606542 RepID=A0A9W7EPC5_9STRA|nr:hypothetical protein TrVE_jg14217 [Triparma verrucosa]